MQESAIFIYFKKRRVSKTRQDYVREKRKKEKERKNRKLRTQRMKDR